MTGLHGSIYQRAVRMEAKKVKPKILPEDTAEPLPRRREKSSQPSYRFGLPKCYPVGGTKKMKRENRKMERKNREEGAATQHQLERSLSWLCRPGAPRPTFFPRRRQAKGTTAGSIESKVAGRVTLSGPGSSTNRTTFSPSVEPTSLMIFSH